MDVASMQRCLLLEIPAELRNRIYEYALAPTGRLILTSNITNRHAVYPVLGLGLLATCRQIHSEAAHVLYTENSICITVNAHDTSWPTIAEARLPQRVLEKLQHLTVVLRSMSYFNASYSDVDWTPFSALVSLRTLRIAVLTFGGTLVGTDVATYRLLSPDSPELVTELLSEILERVPASTELFYGYKFDSEVCKHSDHALQAQERECSDKFKITEVDPCRLAELEVAKHVDRGCKSGVVDDVFWEHRGASSARCGAMRL